MSNWKINTSHVNRYAFMLVMDAPDGAIRFAITDDFVTWIDRDAFDSVAMMHWHVRASKRLIYAISTVRSPDNDPNKSRKLGLSRFILSPNAGQMVDHINGNTLDNRRCNLRAVTPLQNAWNYHGQVRGVSRHKTKRGSATTKWRAAITHAGKWVNLGLYESRDDAIRARLVAEHDMKTSILL